MVLMRVSREKVLMDIASLIAGRGTCSRLQVGAVISREGRIISTGYNGAPAGVDHCFHGADSETVSGCQVAGHAEENAIAHAARYGVSLEGSELHCTHAPCYTCSRMIVNSGITKVTFITPYRLKHGVELLASAGIQVVQYDDMIKLW